MTDVAIRVENLSKQYRIGGPQASYKTIRESLTEAVQAPFRRLSSVVRGQSSVVSNETLWALKDVSFEVQRGEVVGIIGRNGAGKTTLLKVLSRITEPTEGRAEIYGRVGSLLEVGTGFHPELTGRENIYLNGAILGMKRAEIDRKFDEIVAFAEIEKFMDTPVKHYSSGMYVRLAFAVAAHLEPEILLVDEVLAVGDAAFQKKCLGKMGDVAREGRTVLFVSHNMPSIQALCDRTMLLQAGKIIADGESGWVISHYLSAGVITDHAEAVLLNHPHRVISREEALSKVWLLNSKRVQTNSINMGEALTICFQFQCKHPIRNPGLGFGIDDIFGRRIISINNYMVPAPRNTFKRLQAGMAICQFPSVNLLPGRYYVSVAIVEDEREIVDYVQQAIGFDVQPGDVFGSGRIPDRSQGVIFAPAEITVRVTDAVNGVDPECVGDRKETQEISNT